MTTVFRSRNQGLFLFTLEVQFHSCSSLSLFICFKSLYDLKFYKTSFNYPTSKFVCLSICFLNWKNAIFYSTRDFRRFYSTSVFSLFIFQACVIFDHTGLRFELFLTHFVFSEISFFKSSESYLFIGVYLSFAYSIAPFFPFFNSQNTWNFKNIFVEKGELQKPCWKGFTFDLVCGIIVVLFGDWESIS